MTSRRPIAVVLGVIAVTAVLLAWLPLGLATAVAVVATGVLLLLARRLGLTSYDLALDRAHLGRGARWAGVIVLVVAAGYALVYAVPLTRDLLRDDRAPQSLGALAVAVLVVIPLHTVILEEIAFRGVLWGLVARDSGARTATVVSSLAFGLWHLGSAAGALEGNRSVAESVGGSPLVTVLGFAGVVAVTSAAGVVLAVLRERSGSLLAPMALHWAANAAGTVAVFLAT
ncbi:CPBP family intramembrane glutamic endopeptidase [Mumia sp. DW29H23]|uniref:CPBP family intramembrane glutamic endopeptidase n=1 Tax=Mumia sp. DW29H23 TaxID=3421241 RepID=UPI003D6861C5